MTFQLTHRPHNEPQPHDKATDTKRAPGGDSRAAGDHDAIWRDANRVTADTTDSPKSTTGASDERAISDSLDIVKLSFGWFNEAAQRGIEVLRVHLKTEDEPDWFAQIAGALLEVALGAGAAAAGVRLAQNVIPGAGEVRQEFVKMLFEGGIGAGVTAGRTKLGGGKDNNVIDPFIEAQKEGVEAAHHENQNQFIKVGRHDVKTLKTAKSLEAVCSHGNMKAASNEQYAATRDAWVSYLAQTKYGARSGGGVVQESSVNVGNTTTNMSTQEARDRANKSAPGFVPSDAPDLNDAVHGKAPGVLCVHARLREIDILGLGMNGKPEITLALLNGVNATIREQYEGVPLAAMKIPRQVLAEVDGDPDFVINLDEKGDLGNQVPEKRRRWLVGRATVAHPENATKSDFEKYEAGLRLLLAELVPTSIKKPLV